MQKYTLSSQQTWARTMSDLSETFDKWGSVKKWDINYPKGARSESYREQELPDREVILTYVKDGHPVRLVMNEQRRAVDNIRVLYLAVESMRLNERRGIGKVIESAYLQLAAPTQEQSPWEILDIKPNSPLQIAEAAYRYQAIKAHPDHGGDAENMRRLNSAIDAIRKGNA